jgi:hypothetical protein
VLKSALRESKAAVASKAAPGSGSLQDHGIEQRRHVEGIA